MTHLLRAKANTFRFVFSWRLHISYIKKRNYRDREEARKRKRVCVCVYKKEKNQVKDFWKSHSVMPRPISRPDLILITDHTSKKQRKRRKNNKPSIKCHCVSKSEWQVLYIYCLLFLTFPFILKYKFFFLHSFRSSKQLCKRFCTIEMAQFYFRSNNCSFCFAQNSILWLRYFYRICRLALDGPKTHDCLWVYNIRFSLHLTSS